MTILFLSFQMEISFVTFVVVLIFQFLNIEGNGRLFVYFYYISSCCCHKRGRWRGRGGEADEIGGW